MSDDKHHSDNDQDRDDKVVELHAHDDVQLEALYRQAQPAEPPPQADAVIRQAARAAARASKPRYPWFAGVAASLLVGIVFIKIYPEAMPGARHEVREQPSPALTQSVPMPAAPDASEQQDAAASADVVQAQSVARDVASRVDDKALARRKASAQGTMTMGELRSLSSAPAEPAAEPLAGAEDAPQQRAPSFDSMPARSGNFISGGAGIASLERQQQQSPEFLLRRVQQLIEAGEDGQAARLYRQLRQQHPDHPIDDATRLYFEARPELLTIED